MTRSSSPSDLMRSRGLAAQVRHRFDADGPGAELLRRGDHDAAIAAAQIVDRFARLDVATSSMRSTRICGVGMSGPRFSAAPNCWATAGERGRTRWPANSS